MLRQIAFALALSFAAAPASALACGMYVPPEKEKLLAEIFDDIDAPAEDAKTKKKKGDEKAETAEVKPEAADATAPADAVTDAVIPEAQPAS